MSIGRRSHANWVGVDNSRLSLMRISKGKHTIDNQFLIPGCGYEYDHKVAEVKIEKVEKGKISESLVYVRYWSRKWMGIGLPPPGGQSFSPQPEKGQMCRFYLAKNSYDGLSEKGNQDGGYNVVYVNGVEPIKE